MPKEISKANQDHLAEMARQIAGLKFQLLEYRLSSVIAELNMSKLQKDTSLEIGRLILKVRQEIIGCRRHNLIEETLEDIEAILIRR